ncbi:MAG: Cof-type HAD-IIB family hydrolase [Oscillospiraceae bacterium]|nr:Cof-type HAD-IIB family hydrolase [Oscillospiraceae bacterium]
MSLHQRKTPIRMIALDLDGTLLNSEKHVSARNRQALAAAAAAGVAVVPCSGRALDSIPQEVLQLEGVRYAVSSGGGAAYDLASGEELVYNPVPAAIAHEVADLTVACGGWAECYSGRHSYTPAEQIADIRAFMQDRDFVYLNRRPVQELHDWIDVNAACIVKLNLMFREAGQRTAVIEALQNRTDLILSSASDHNLEVNAADGGKGDALCALGARLGIPPQQIMACGDQLNDLSMLRAVGFPVAMGNAVPQIKEIAAHVTLTNEQDGVAAAVERFVLNA